MSSLLLVLAACAVDDDRAPPRETATKTPAPAAIAAASSEAPPAQSPSPEPEPSFANAWERLADAPLALTEVTVAAHDGRIWVAGGFTADGSASPATLIFNPADESWREGPTLPAGIHHAVLVSDDERLYLLGGFLGPGFEQPTAEVWTLEPADDEWTAGPALPEPRGAAAAAWDGTRIALGGGVGPGGVASDVYALSADGWERIAELSEPRQHLAAASDAEGRVWFLGGRHSSLDTNVGSVDLLTEDQISRLAAELTPRSGVAAFWSDAVGACLLGGETPSGTLAEVECVADDGQILELPPLAVARHGLGVALFDDGAYALLGGEQPGLFVSPAAERLRAE